MEFGLQALTEALDHQVDVLFVDEVGPWELQGRGWAPGLDVLARQRRTPMVWVVREGLIEEVKRRWGISDVLVWEASSAKAGEILEALRYDEQK